MLVQIVIENLALIERVELSPGPGLNVMTGETGAGKSILVDAMNLLIGGRASSDQVRTGAGKAVVEGLFDYRGLTQVTAKLNELGIPESEDGTLLLSREVVRNGRSSSRINGRVLPLSLYRSLGELLVDLHGQHEHQSLLDLEQHRELLDRYGGEELLKLRSEVESIYARLSGLADELERCRANQEKGRQRAAFLEDSIKEIDRLHPQPGEDEELRQERERLRHGERLAELVREAIASLSGGESDLPAADRLVADASSQVREMARYDPSLQEVAATLEEIGIRLEDAAGTLRHYSETLDFNPDRVQQVEDRLYALRGLMQKYGVALTEINDYREDMAAELAGLHNNDHRLRKLGDEYRRELENYRRREKELSGLRRRLGKGLAAVVAGELHTLGMPYARFDIDWKRTEEPQPLGGDHPELIFSANPGEPLKPLARIASGGEMSRVMLALKVILAAADRIPTLIFDEIDSGIGGRTLQAVARKLTQVAESKQVFCVTHSPQIAGCGTSHFFIEKMVDGGQTRTQVTTLQGEARVNELVRMMGGSGDQITREHARRLLDAK